MNDFFRFPHTPHLIWLGAGSPREDKVFSPAEAEQFLSQSLRIEEKVDGANTGISFDSDGTLRVQNRGSYLEPPWSGQYVKFGYWLQSRIDSLFDQLQNRYILFGEWCYASHSLQYDQLPDWFLAFDVYDKSTGFFLDSVARNTIAHAANIKIMAAITQGSFNVSELTRLVHEGKSAYKTGLMEGIILRHEETGKTLGRTKLVHPDFVQNIDTHWRKGQILANSVRHL